MEKNYSTMEKKTMVLYRKLLNFDLLWKIGYNEKKLRHYSKL